MVVKKGLKEANLAICFHTIQCHLFLVYLSFRSAPVPIFISVGMTRGQGIIRVVVVLVVVIGLLHVYFFIIFFNPADPQGIT